MTHVFLTGETGIGKSGVLARTLDMLNARAHGFETRFEPSEDASGKALYMRSYNSSDKGCLLARMRRDDRAFALPRFEVIGCALLRRAYTLGSLIVIDEAGRLERDAELFQREIRLCLDSDKPVLGVLRQNGAQWADWIRNRPDVRLITVTRENRDSLPRQAAAILRPMISPVQDTPWTYNRQVCYELEEQAHSSLESASGDNPRRYVSVWVANARGRFLVIRRHPHLRRYPDLLDVPGGCARQGERMAQAASRALLNGTGIQIAPNRLKSLGRAFGSDWRFEAFLASAYVALTDVRLRPDEATQASWEEPAAISQLIALGRMVKPPRTPIPLLPEIAAKPGDPQSADPFREERME